MTMDQTIFPETDYLDEQGQSITQQNNGWMYSAMYTGKQRSMTAYFRTISLTSE
jgi:hypothetical protein